jgi:hypothetical protein
VNDQIQLEKVKLYLEIRSQLHEMLFEGTHETRPKKTEIEKAVVDKGFVPFEYDIWFDSIQNIWRFSGQIRRRT